jgi:flavin reductase (DIM6/NTAB) family NADH-FMN oxidoreductase RutF
MAKQIWKASTMLNPVPVVMVTCTNEKGQDNIITLAWAGTVNSEPPMISISVRKERFSYNIIKEKGEFGVNLVNRKLTFAADFCGVKSGLNVDKFKSMNLTKENSSKITVPLIKESPISLECKVRNIIELGSHDLFIGEILAVNVEENLLDIKGKLHIQKADLVCYSHGEYYGLEKSLGFFGFSVAKKKIRR